MATFTNTAREVELPNGDIVKLHNGVMENNTANIKKFKYDDNGHVTESTPAKAADLNLNNYSTPTTGTTDIGASDDVQTAIGKLDHQSHIDQTNIQSILDGTTIDSFGDVETALSNKVDKVTGKGLSSNDYTNDEKDKLNNIQAGAEVNVQADWSQTTTTDDSYIKNKPTLGTAATANTTDFATAAQGTKADNAIPSSEKGVANGVASLDSSGKVPSTQLPSYVDDVLEYSAKSSFPAQGETGKIYVDTTNNKTYRWSGSAYVEISASLALGETSSTAYYGNKGKTAYTHATETRLTTATASGLYKVASTAQGHIASLTSVAKADITALGIPAQDTTYGVVSTSVNGLAPKVTDTSKFLKGDGTWATPANTWTAMVGATSSANGSVGYVNAVPPKDGYNTKYLRADGTWQVPPNTTYSDATTSASGLMSATDKSKLNGIAAGATAVSESTVSGWGFTKNTGTYSKPSTGIPKTDLASAVQTSLGKADSALQSHQTIKQDGVTGATVNRFGTCSIAAGTAAKTVSITTGTFTLEAGARVTVKFSNANTAGTPTLNVNSTGAKNIFHKGAQITTGSNKGLLAGTVDFIYDGTQYHLIGNYIDSDTNTHRPIQVNGAEILGNNTTALNLKAGSNVSLSNSSGTVTIAATDTTYSAATQSAAGLMSASDKTKLDGIATGAQVNSITGVKGNSESSYRTGNVNITPANIGAVALTGNTITGDIQRKQTEIDASKANNNISATKYPTTYSIIDNSGRILVRNEAIVEPSGNISWYAYVRNYNTSGGQVAQKGIKYTVNKSGTGTWTVDDSASFKSAIGLADLSKLFSPAYTKPTKDSNITSIDDGGYIQIGKLTILNMRFTVGTACGQYTDLFTDCPLPLSSLSGGYGVVACSANTNIAFAICANGRLQNYSGTLPTGAYVVSACYMTQ